MTARSYHPNSRTDASSAPAQDILTKAVPTVYPVGSGTLSVLSTNRFKAGLLTVGFCLPQTRENVILTPLLFSVLRRGCERYPTLAALNRRLDTLYAASLRMRGMRVGDRVYAALSANFLDASYLPEPLDLPEGIVEVIEQVLFHPLLDENGLFLASYVESEKDLQINDIRSLRDVPAQYAAEQANRLFLRDTPFALPIGGTEEDVAAVTPAALTAFWRSLCGRVTPVCFYVGGGDPAPLSRSLSRLFPASESPVFPSYLPLRDAPADPLRFEESLPAEQSHLILWFRTGDIAGSHPLRPAMLVAAELLGGSAVSLLFTQVREKLSLCYSIWASYNGTYGAIQVTCALLASNRSVAERAILDQVDTLRAGAFSDADLDAAKRSLIGEFDRMADRPASLTRFWQTGVILGKTETPAGFAARVRSVDRAAVQAAARSIAPDTFYFLRGEDPENEHEHENA